MHMLSPLLPACSTAQWHSCVNAWIMTCRLCASLSSFPSLSFIPLCLSHSLSVSNALTLHRWLSVGTSSEVLMGHTHDAQVNKQAGWGGGDSRSWSKVRITGKSHSSMQGCSSSCGIITPKICFNLQLFQITSSKSDKMFCSPQYILVCALCYFAFSCAHNHLFLI